MLAPRSYPFILLLFQFCSSCLASKCVSTISLALRSFFMLMEVVSLAEFYCKYKNKEVFGSCREHIFDE